MKLFKNISKKKILIISMIFFMFLSFPIFYFILKVSAQSVSVVPNLESVIAPTVIVSQVLSKLPVHIIIPRIRVNSIIEYVGLTQDGSVDSPIGPDNVAWFSEGPIPGSIGNAIIDGHSGWKNNIPAVFDNLKNLKKGDKIYIENEIGTINTFVVKKLKIYHKNDIALDVFNSYDNKSHLNLITCSGLWNVLENGSEDRIVVFSDLLE